MKQIIINEEQTKYYILEDGRVFNKDTNTYLKGHVNGGYRYYDLRWKHKKYSFSAHRLVGLYYLDNPHNYPVVRHKDNNRLHNHKDNLEWVSFSTNNLHIHRAPTTTQWDSRKLPIGEMRNYKGSIYNITEYGQVYNTQTGKYMKGKKSAKGYIEYSLIIDGRKISCLAHRLVGEVFLDYIPGMVINHKDGNKQNNHYTNLEWISQADNILHSYYQLGGRVPKVYQLDEEYNIIREYRTCKEAGDAMKVRPQSINQAIQCETKSCGYYWRH